MEDRITDKQAALLKKLGVAVDYKMSMGEASELINEVLNKPKTKKISEMPQPRNVRETAPMWGRYAVDLLIARLTVQAELIKEKLIPIGKETSLVDLATEAIQIVLSMRSQFRE